MTRKILKLRLCPRRRGRGWWRFLPPVTVTLAVLASGGLLLDANFGGLSVDQVVNGAVPITCDAPYVIDGDTIDCAGTRIRLKGIDAPEMQGHCRQGRSCVSGDPAASRDFLEGLTRGSVTCVPEEIDHYGRTVARCSADGRDLSCAMIAAKQAVRRYGFIFCSG